MSVILDVHPAEAEPAGSARATHTPMQRPSQRPIAVSSYIPALDGLRGLAVLAVLFFHLRIPKFSLGWTGVELFFVLSGFLITRILLNTRDSPEYFRKFYIRRALRIFPVYYLVVVAYSAVMLWRYGQGLGTLSFYYIYLQTIPQLKTEFSCFPLLGHTWTLAIEEQFYLMWPLAVFLLRGRRLFFAMIAMILGALSLRFLSLGSANPFFVDGWLGVQVDALAAGALVAYASRIYDKQVLQRWYFVAFLAGATSLAILLCAAGNAAFWSPRLWGRTWWGPLLISVLACAFAGAVGLAAIGQTGTRWLRFQPLIRWGKISYGIYLYHPFTFLFVEMVVRHFGYKHNHLLAGSVILAKLGLTYSVAWISWTALENPINRLKGRFG